MAQYKLRDIRQFQNIIFENDDEFLKGESSLSEDEEYLYEYPSSSDSEIGTEAESGEEENGQDVDGTEYNESSEKVKQATTTTKNQFDQRKPVLKGRNGFVWNLRCEEKEQRTVTTRSPGALGVARDVLSPKEYWNLLINDNMQKLILHNTNIEIAKRRQRQKSTDISYHTDLTAKELNAFCGLLYLSGFQKICNKNIDELWSIDLGCTIFRCTMTQTRFLVLFTCLRFDDKSTRFERQSDDPFAIIRELWDMFIGNCRKYYTPSQYCTIDTQLLSYHPMKLEPDKYGFKIMTLNDARTYYMLNAIPYVAEAPRNETVQYYYVKRLTEPIHNSNRTIVTNSWFTSVDLFEAMLHNYNLTMIGIIKKDEADIPDEIKRSRQVGSSLLCYSKEMTLVSYVPQKNRVVLLLSSLHLTKQMEKNDKPEIFNLYNKTKRATKNFDQLLGKYTTARKTRHWPMRFFLTMLDQAGVNALILYTCNKENEKLRRREFLKNLALSLILPFLHKRLKTRTLNQTIKRDIKDILKIK